jgi:HPt (histidine-containing phosphotransfer) domain-containing protein
MSSREEKFSKLRAELRVEFLAEFPNRLKILQKYLELGQAQDWMGEFHKLKGTAATYGFPELGEFVERLEPYLQMEHPDKELLYRGVLKIMHRMLQEWKKGLPFSLEKDKLVQNLFELSAISKRG